MSLYRAFRPLLFSLPAETAHGLGKHALRAVGRTPPARAAAQSLYGFRHPALEIERFGRTFPSPVGMAAGFDKDGEVVGGLAALGFGFVEVGTVTPAPQSGNPRPRLFRLPEDRGLVNRLAFPGKGADYVARRLARDGPFSVPVGMNIGKMNDSVGDEAVADYRAVLDRVADVADYIVVNVSCPNTPGDESDPDHLRATFAALADTDHGVPLLVKVGPDDARDDLAALVDIVESFDVDGIVATNTTTDHTGLASPHADETGGVSGRPLESRATETIRTLYGLTDLPIVGVGGVDSAETAYRKIRSGASLVELYTGFIYGGPNTARAIGTGLVDLLVTDGFSTVEEAVGADAE